MPHWVIYHPLDTFQDVSTRQALAKDITSIYAAVGMPEFYVVVNFIPTPDEQQFVGGVVARTRGKPFVRITIDHIHVNLPKGDTKAYSSIVGRVNATLKPHIEDKGYDSEYHIAETERLLWNINSLAPPEFKSEDEKVWVKENRAVPPQEMEEARKRLNANL
ncbi:Putative Tautomerase/MIF superfamily, tautomerase, cis-CaaD [Septoria linicola]|uniref:Tautomerase/MIF superfamily, tautomerase, cis-CaaD n=1 Tax=Septoria linicola TaxID=215465 RepID=A0A9Q9ARV5_9PEZI|nr:putative Tautomerase/MIF superfamily, tautomerase, cis-CaaD [Septoria linicola]USW54622.1 Putative Tautomerase/MIF superfamily, tautomerase, cis-CaaD [Septoria linicola]